MYAYMYICICYMHCMGEILSGYLAWHPFLSAVAGRAVKLGRSPRWTSGSPTYVYIYI